MKKIYLILILLTIILIPNEAQKLKDALYLKNGSIIYGRLIEISENQYKIQTADGSLLIYQESEVQKFTQEPSAGVFKGRKDTGLGMALEAGFLVGAQNTEYPVPFSFNIMGNYTIDKRSVFGIGSGAEFLGVPFMPLFGEYRLVLRDRKASPYFLLRGGKMFHVGEETTDDNDYYSRRNFKGGLTGTIGTGISWALNDIEPYISFAYRYAETSYVKKEWYNNDYYDATYKNNFNRLEVKFGFKF